MSDKLDKYFASIYLAMVGDKIGFGDGYQEMNSLYDMLTIENNKDFLANAEGVTYQILYIFLADGGISNINLNILSISDDTVMHLDTVKGLLEHYNNINELTDNILKHYLESFKDLNFMKNKLLAGKQTIDSIKKIQSGTNWSKFVYNKNAGGNGSVMRSMCIGLAFHRPSDLNKLIETCILSTLITHPNCTACIGSIVSALFTSYALNGINPEKWIFELLDILESDMIDKILLKIRPTFIDNFKDDKQSFIFKLNTYIETSFDENYNYSINSKHNRAVYPWKRIYYYFDNFITDKKLFYVGAGADDCVIIAYDCLLLSKNNYERLIYTSMIIVGDSDTIGSVASSWYGALYGINNILNTNLIEENEEYNNIKKISEQLYYKYYNKTSINE